MQERKAYPNFWNALLILCLLLGLQMMFSIIAYDLGYEFEAGDAKATTVITILSCAIVFSVLMLYKNMRYSEIFTTSSNTVTSMALVFTIPLLFIMGGAVFWISDISNLIILLYPMSEDEYLMFSRLLGSGVISIIAVCIVAPFVEEILFRGIFLRSFLYNYSALKAIVLSTFLFAVAHLNIYQIPIAIILGSFLGWLYIRSQSLWPCIIAHVLYNTCAMLFWLIKGGGNHGDISMVVEFNSTVVNIFAGLSSIIGVVVLMKIFSLQKKLSC